MSEKILCIEITGEGAYHTFLNQSGHGGADYRFFKNDATGTYIRAYRTLEDYLSERDDMHTVQGVWPLKANLLSPDQITAHCYTTPEPVKPKAEPEQALEAQDEPTPEWPTPETADKPRRGRPRSNSAE